MIVTFHGERLLAHNTLLSLQRSREAATRAGYRVQFVLSLDRADPETRRVVNAFPGLCPGDVVTDVEFGDLGLSRNNAIALASGEFIGICDGDDYFCEGWIRRCVELARAHGPATIWHPEWIVLFEGTQEIYRQVGQSEPGFDRDAMLVVNPWNSCSFAHRDVYRQFPYALARPRETGFGFEDWHWNCETLAHGLRHELAHETLHFVRRKHRGSLNLAHASAGSLIPPTRLFDLPA